MFLKTCAVCLVFLTMCLTTDAQTADLKTPMNITKSTENTNKEESQGTIQRKGRESPERKYGTDSKPINPNLPPNLQLKTQNPKVKSTQIPINLVIDTKPRTVPAIMPTVVTTTNAKPILEHYVRLKSEPDRKRTAKPTTNINVDLKNDPAVSKVMPKNNVTPKCSRIFKPCDEIPYTRKHKFKCVNFYEDDTNIDSLPPASKQPATRKSKKPEYTSDSSNCENDCDYDSDVVHIKNATHVIRISKIPQHSDNHGNGHKTSNDHKKPHREMHEEKHPTDKTDVYKGPENDEVTVAMVINKDCEKCELAESLHNSIIDAIPAREPPVIAHCIHEDPNDYITITNHNYEEIEERPAYAEAHNIVDDPSLSTPIREAISENLGSNYPQSYQQAYDKYLKFIYEANPSLCKKSNCYPRVPPPEDYPLEYPYAGDSQAFHDVYGVKPESMSVVDVRPDNNLGRIWRTWKDTEIKISKPNMFNNKQADSGRNYNDFNYGEILKQPRQMYTSQPISFNGYYDNLNNPLPYPYSYPSYRYMM